MSAAYSYVVISRNITVRGKILEGEIFGESLLMKQMARKILANLLEGLLAVIFTVFITIGAEKFGELYTIRQIRQNFPPPKFSHVRYWDIFCNCLYKLLFKSLQLYKTIREEHIGLICNSTGCCIVF